MPSRQAGADVRFDKRRVGGVDAAIGIHVDRKFVASRLWPIRSLVCDTSLAFTAPFPLVSPISTPICALISPTSVPLFTPDNVSVIL